MNPIFKLKFFERLFGTRDFVEPEKLTDERVRKILGDYANHTVIYNFDTGKWNRDYYLGHRIMSVGVNCYNMRSNFNDVIPNKELVAVVGMAIEEPRLRSFVYLPRPAASSYKSPLAYATFITRDRKTGKLDELPQKWIKLSDCAHQSFVCEAMPQLLSGIGFSSARNIDIMWCMDGHKITDPLLEEVDRTKQLQKCDKFLAKIKEK